MSNFSTLALLAILFFFFYRRSDVNIIFIVALFLIREEIFFFFFFSLLLSKISTKRFQDSYGFVERRVGELKRKSFPWRSDSATKTKDG